APPVAPNLVSQQPKMDKAPPRKPFELKTEQFAAGDSQDNLRLKREAGAQLDKNAPLKTQANQFALQAQTKVKLLANYNMELLVDRSMSMHKLDCPDGLSRWNWCGQQAANLASALAPSVPNGLTITPFASEYDVFEHATANNINQLFHSVGLQLGTRLWEPLAERLDTYFAHRNANSKPLLIVVITDGVPFPKWEPDAVRNELVQTSLKMKDPGEVTVIFCQIGYNDPIGQQFLFDLDRNLLSYGARYHFVHTISFQDLQQRGLGPSLVTAIKQNGPGSFNPTPRQNGNFTSFGASDPRRQGQF
ncbi:MAG: hypothetical protein ACRD3W_06590, partial [Terriglobales bacterium]